MILMALAGISTVAAFSTIIRSPKKAPQMTVNDVVGMRAPVPSEEVKKAAEEFAAQTTDVIVVAFGNLPVALIFISTDGSRLLAKVSQCKADAVCAESVRILAESKRIEVLQVKVEDAGTIA